MYSPPLWRRKLSAVCSFLSRCLYLRRDRLGTALDRDARRQLRCCEPGMASTWQKTPRILQLEKVEIQGQTRGHWSVPHLQSPLSSPRSSLWRRLELWALLVAYNLALVALSTCMFYEVRRQDWLLGSDDSVLASYRYLCQPVDYSWSELGMRVFLIPCKKQEQVTFLHVYHHGSMLFSWWSGVKYVPGGQAFFIGMLRSFVHIFMYDYYTLASLGPWMRRHVWWERYLTILQPCQFVAIAAHSSYNFFTECPFPDGFNTTVFLYILSLFLCFCYQTCVRERQEKLT